MIVRDLIAELQKFPELSTVFVQTSESDVIHQLDSTHEVYVRPLPGSGFMGPYVELHDNETPKNNEVIDYGVLIYA